MANRGRRMLEAMIDTCPLPVTVRNRYGGDCEILLSYGAGHEGRRPWVLEHIRRRRRFVGVDLGYWDRPEPDAGMRITLDGDHCTKFLRPEPAHRWDSRGVPLRSDANPEGVIMVIGQGIKSRRIAGQTGAEWLNSVFDRVRAAHPGVPIAYRRKRQSDPMPRRVLSVPEIPIEEALTSARMVVCQHSNVAVDACIAGVPVVCTAGAASSLYGSDLCNPINPTPAHRLEFLRSLAWWNWRPSEARELWTYLLERVRSG